MFSRGKIRPKNLLYPISLVAAVEISEVAEVKTSGVPSREAEDSNAAGVSMMMRQLGGAFGVAITVAVFAATGRYGSPVAFADGFLGNSQTALAGRLRPRGRLGASDDEKEAGHADGEEQAQRIGDLGA